MLLYSLLGNGISIHASAKEATMPCPAVCCKVSISIHASAKEATEANKESPEYLVISIHASAKEATGEVWTMTVPKKNFNPRLREGGDRKVCALR